VVPPGKLQSWEKYNWKFASFGKEFRWTKFKRWRGWRLWDIFLVSILKVVHFFWGLYPHTSWRLITSLSHRNVWRPWRNFLSLVSAETGKILSLVFAETAPACAILVLSEDTFCSLLATGHVLFLNFKFSSGCLLSCTFIRVHCKRTTLRTEDWSNSRVQPDRDP